MNPWSRNELADVIERVRLSSTFQGAGAHPVSLEDRYWTMIVSALRAEQGDTIRHDMARILQTACDADEADPRSLLNEIAQIASKHPWPTTKRKDEQSISTEEARNGVDNQGNRRSPPHSVRSKEG